LLEKLKTCDCMFIVKNVNTAKNKNFFMLKDVEN